MIGFRPCGACAAYVPADTGCDHWKPRLVAERVASQDKRRERVRQYKQNAKEARARKLAKEAVDAFRAQRKGR